MTRKVDVCILGAGSAGLYATGQVSRKTKDFLIIDPGPLGTTCARVGCMPSKVLIQAADDLWHARHHFAVQGIHGGEDVRADVRAVLAHVRKMRDGFASGPAGKAQKLADAGKLISAPARFVAPDAETGQYATGIEVLTSLKNSHPIINEIIKWRSLNKLQTAYLDSLPKEVNPKTGKIHTEFLQAMAATGRLSSKNPNMQNITIRTEEGRKLRKAFIPRDEDYVLLAADYSQIELRIIAALSKEKTMIEAFKNGEDIHASTAAKIFGIPLDEVTREQRSNAKTVNFGIIYGVSAFGLSNQTSLTRSESKELIDTYYQTYPKLRKYMSGLIDFARENGYVETVLGRRRYLKDINSRNAVVRGAAERNAVNAPIQGSAADIIKLAMIHIYDRFEKENIKSKMLLQVHDELVFDARKDELEIIKPIIKQEMENAYKLIVPLDVEMGVGENWLEAH